MEGKGDIAVIGLAVMGQNLILNMNDHGSSVVAYNRTVSKVDEFLAKEARGIKVLGAHSIGEMVKLLKRPRRVRATRRSRTIHQAGAMKFVEQIRQALYASKIVSYTQGYMLMRAAAKEYGWNLNYGGIALMCGAAVA
jgi:6-phosphogluconate dehydrogenase